MNDTEIMLEYLSTWRWRAGDYPPPQCFIEAVSCVRPNTKPNQTPNPPLDETLIAS